MRSLPFAITLALAACSPVPTGEAESENAIAERASEIRNQADADIAKQIAEIDASANAEAAELSAVPTNAQ